MASFSATRPCCFCMGILDESGGGDPNNTHSIKYDTKIGKKILTFTYIFIASQMWCLSTLLPIIIHDLVPEDNPDWELFTDLIKIVDILISLVIPKETTSYLQLLIKEYLEEFRYLYPNTRLIPKQHFMVYYPAQIRRYVKRLAVMYTYMLFTV